MPSLTSLARSSLSLKVSWAGPSWLLQLQQPNLTSLTPFRSGLASPGPDAVKIIAKHNLSHCLLTGDNENSAQRIIQELETTAPLAKVTFVKCNLASFASIHEAADQIISVIDRLDIFICDAGFISGPPALTKDGYESQFAVNHLAPALLIKHLLPILV